MPFDLDLMFRYSLSAIGEFSKRHQNETFYAFAIDAPLLCFNSVESFEKTLASYKMKYPEYYDSEEDIQSLKFNTGDWEYQGFADLRDCTGFDDELYSLHYNLGLDSREPNPGLSTTEYALAVQALIERLQEAGAFNELNKTGDFRVCRPEHNY